MPHRIAILAAAALVLASAPSPFVRDAAARCDPRDRACRIERMRDGALSPSQLRRERVIRLREADRQRRRSTGYGLPFPSQRGPCGSRPIITGERTRAVPTC